ncbi:MAG TPA: peptidylprolyl isomerase [Lentisphaeria bacterium]|nr:MAG: peptidylprolyl isomerase [Lentisphaerae bacterium GWF2_38_69]HBM15100.1 peptidylprolyl isomerase [Lentisphaeria bacterium]
MKKATARHILVSSKEICNELKKDIEKGADFADIARDFSECPSSSSGGDLGEFNEGEMVKEFNKAVFKGEIGKLIGPVKTQFGYHLIEVQSISDSSEDETFR